MYTTSLVDGGVIPPQVAIGGRLGRDPVFRQRSRVSRLLPGELSRAERRCAGARRLRPLDLPRTAEQCRHDRRAVIVERRERENHEKPVCSH